MKGEPVIESNVFKLRYLSLFIVVFGAIFYIYIGDKKSNDIRAHSKDSLVYIEKPIVDFGHVYRPTPRLIEHIYNIQNISSNIIKIKIASKSCNCTEAYLINNEIEPGEYSMLKVKWKPPSQPGSQAFKVFIQTDPPNDSPLELSGHVFVKNYFLIEPMCLSFEKLMPGQEYTKRVILQSPSGQDLSKSISFDVEGLTNDCIVNMESLTNYKAIFNVTITGQYNRDTQVGHLVISTGDKVKPVIRIPISVSHLGKYFTEPNLLLFDEKDSQKTKRKVRILSHIGSKVIVKRVVSDLPRLIKSTIMDDRSVIELELNTKTIENKSLTGKISVFLEGEDLPIQIYYMAI